MLEQLAVALQDLLRAVRLDELPAVRPQIHAVTPLSDEPHELERWLLQRFGGLTSHNEYTYNFPKIAKQLGKLDPRAPVVLDLPFAQDMDILESLLPHERVFNLNHPFGAPGEVSLAYEYYQQFSMSFRSFNYSVWTRNSDRAAERFTEFLDRLEHFQSLAERGVQ